MDWMLRLAESMAGLFRYDALLILGLAVGVFMLGRWVIKRDEREEKKNSAAPVRTVWARISYKRTGEIGIEPAWFLTFRAPDGTSRELRVSLKDFQTWSEGDCGELTYQRRRFLSFTPQEVPAELRYALSHPGQQLSPAMPEQPAVPAETEAQNRSEPF
ncbi:MAG: DUF2500 domain-containing protein [Oscillospiraceae bacterium]|nr:DUF2500 domain-containing protein [Oscillospiraceae bacterium]MCR5305442.1 DUF2500 domain-containing protein [Oscillospiraceae bacterium]